MTRVTMNKVYEDECVRASIADDDRHGLAFLRPAFSVSKPASQTIMKTPGAVIA